MPVQVKEPKRYLSIACSRRISDKCSKRFDELCPPKPKCECECHIGYRKDPIPEINKINNPDYPTTSTFTAPESPQVGLDPSEKQAIENAQNTIKQTQEERFEHTIEKERKD